MLQSSGIALLTAGFCFALSSAPLSAQAVRRPLGPPYLEAMTWTEIRDAIGGGKRLAIIPTGGTEQNGPHMVLGKHNYIVTFTAGQLADRLGNALVAPTVQYVPEGDYTVEIGKAKVVREVTKRDRSVTILAWGAMLYEAIAAADKAAEQGIECEIIDLRTLWPVDIDTIAASVAKTGRVIVVHEAPRTCGFGAELVALVNEHCFLSLEAPPVRVAGFDTPFPYTLEMDYLPLAHRILPAIVETAQY